jgi:hypothetical protein
MNDQQRMADIEVLARMAARLAGRNCDERLTIKLADVVAFDDIMWRYPDFIARGEAAYEALTAGKLPHPAPAGREGHPSPGCNPLRKEKASVRRAPPLTPRDDGS